MTAKRILVVDDDRVIRLMVRDVLEAAGYHVATLDRSTAVVAGVQAHAPDLLLLDLMMEEANGLDVLTRLAAAGMQCIVVMLSAYLSGPRAEAWVQQAREMGVRYFLSKPFDLNELLTTVAAALAGGATQ